MGVPGLQCKAANAKDLVNPDWPRIVVVKRNGGPSAAQLVLTLVRCQHLLAPSRP